MSKNIFMALHSEYDFLSRVEKNIADVILNTPDDFLTYSMAELSKVAGVSQGSINNFAKKYSSGGFSSLKLKIAGCLSTQGQEPFSVIDGSQSLISGMEMKIKSTTAAFYNTLELNDEASLKAAVSMILKAKSIQIFGVFHSGIVANDFCYRLIQLGIPATFVSDTLMCAVSASMLDEKDLVIAISSSGRTREIVDAVDIAAKNRTPVICLTCSKFSPLAQKSDCVLLSSASGVAISEKSPEIRLSQILVLDTLCSHIRSIIDAEGQEHYYKLKDIISSHAIKD